MLLSGNISLLLMGLLNHVVLSVEVAPLFRSSDCRSSPLHIILFQVVPLARPRLHSREITP